MSGKRGRLLVCTLVMGLAGTGRSVFAAVPEQEGVDHVRTSSAVISRLIDQATERSQTFKGLVDAVDASDGIVYIEKGDCGQGLRSCFVNVTMAVVSLHGSAVTLNRWRLPFFFELPALISSNDIGDRGDYSAKNLTRTSEEHPRSE